MADKSQHETRSSDAASTGAPGLGASGPGESGARSATPGLGKPVQGSGQAGMESAQQTNDQAERSARSSGNAIRHGGEAAADVMRRSGDAGAETMRHFGSVAQDAMQHGTGAAATAQRELARHAASHVEDVGKRVATAVQDTARDMRAVFDLPAFSGRGLQDMRQGMAGLLDGVLQTNIRMMQEMLRVLNPAVAVEMQQRVASEYLDTFLEHSATILRASRQTAEEALRPLEQHVQERRQVRQSNGHEQHGQDRQQKQSAGRVSDIMEKDVRLASPEDTVQRAAQLMREEDTGILPVGEGDRLVGMVTDRDVALRLVAEGRDPRQTRVREVMSQDVRYVFEDESAEHVAENMAEQQVRRLPVVNRDKKLVGIVSLADFARKGKPQLSARALGGVARQGGQHSQAAE